MSKNWNPVYFVKNDKCKGKNLVTELTWNARDLNLSPSPFYNQKVARKMIQICRDNLWEDEWVNSGSYVLEKVIVSQSNVNRLQN